MHWEQNLFLPPKSTFLRSWQPLLFGSTLFLASSTNLTSELEQIG